MLYNAFVRMGKDSSGIILSYMERGGKSYVPSAVEGCWLTCCNSSPCTGGVFVSPSEFMQTLLAACRTVLEGLGITGHSGEKTCT